MYVEWLIDFEAVEHRYGQEPEDCNCWHGERRRIKEVKPLTENLSTIVLYNNDAISGVDNSWFRTLPV